MNNELVQKVKNWKLEKGDTVFVKWDQLDMNDGQGPWIPGAEELERVREQLESLIPEGVKVCMVPPFIESITPVKGANQTQCPQCEEWVSKDDMVDYLCNRCR